MVPRRCRGLLPGTARPRFLCRRRARADERPQWAITIGLLIAAIVVNGTKDINSEACYRIPIGIQFIWAAILSGGLFFLPESPRYLILKGRDDEARRSLGRLLATAPDSEEVQAEYVDIATNLEAEREVGATSYLDCFRMGPGKNCLRVCTGIALQAWQQLTGINFIFYYGASLCSGRRGRSLTKVSRQARRSSCKPASPTASSSPSSP